MRFNLIALDETADWNPEIIEKTGKLYTIYIYNPNEKTFCCEITPSFYLSVLGNNYISEFQTDDDLDQEIKTAIGFANDSIFVHCRDIEKLKTRKPITTFHDDNLEFSAKLFHSQTGFENEEDALDYFSGNQCL